MQIEAALKGFATMTGTSKKWSRWARFVAVEVVMRLKSLQQFAAKNRSLNWSHAAVLTTAVKMSVALNLSILPLVSVRPALIFLETQTKKLYQL